MAEDYRDKIQEIRNRRRGEYGPGAPGPGVGGHPGGYGGQGGQGHGGSGGGGYNAAPSIGMNQGQGVSSTMGVNVTQQAQSTESLFGPDFKSPWLRDRVTLSLEGQIAMMELRSNSKVGMVDLGYTNRIPILPIRSGIFVKIEPPGTYKLCYHYR